MSKPLLILGWIFVICPVHASAESATEFARVNDLRARAGLPALAAEPRLAEAARRHAAYLDRHRTPGKAAHGVSAHTQQAGRDGFVGESPADRALAVGYPHREVLENVSMGYGDAATAIDGLMSAIYHRLTFLDLFADQLGVAVGTRSRVFVMGRSDRSGVCKESPAEALLHQPLDCLGTPMRRDYYTRLCATLPDHALFRPAHPVSCPDGTRLDAGYMAGLCDDLPPAARFRGYGRYFAPCGDDRRVDADWFKNLCAGGVPEALARGDGSYYAICDDRYRVDAGWFASFCAELPAEARFTGSLRYRRPCAEPLDVRVDYLEQQDADRLADRPAFVAWPPDGARDVPPAFFVEEPDPLPDKDVAGYPLSLQFNPGRIGQVEVNDFALYRVRDGGAERLAPTRLLDAATDPNGLLTAWEFALFPLERLAWGARYRVVADVTLDGHAQRVTWHFRTREAAAPLLIAKDERETFVVNSGGAYWLYLPPTADVEQTVLSVRTEHRRGNSVTIAAIDDNTLSVRLEARFCDRVRMRFDSGREVVLIPRGCPG